MNPSDVKTAVSFEFWVLPVLSDEKIENIKTGAAKFDALDTVGEYALRAGDKNYRVKLKDEACQNDLDFHLQRGSPHLAEVIQDAPDGGVLLRVFFYSGRQIEMGEISLGITTEMHDKAGKNGIKAKNLEDFGNFLSGAVMMETGGKSFFLISVNMSPLENSDQDDDSPSDEAFLGDIPFVIYGNGVRIPVERRKISVNEEKLYATKIIYSSFDNTSRSLRLVSGSVSFFSEPERVKNLAAGAMAKLTLQMDSYLRMWDKYGEIEGRLCLERARKIGEMKFTNCEQMGGGKVRFWLSSPFAEELAVEDILEIRKAAPEYIFNEDMNYLEYFDLKNHRKTKKNAPEAHDQNLPYAQKLIEEEEKEEEYSYNETPDFDGEKKKFNRGTDTAKIIGLDTDRGWIDVELERKPEDGMKLFMSISGDAVQFDRRINARRLIQDGKSANPILGLLLEEGTEEFLPSMPRRRNKLITMTPFVKKKIFGKENAPTPKQQEAIAIALNTPDLALIQGPPGTGKTKVITAIAERLNEESDTTDSTQGLVLVSGFQHDAVENIVERLSINNLPQIKFGRKRTDDDDDSFSRQQERLDEWREKLTKKINEKYPDVRASGDERNFEDAWAQYALSCGSENARSILKSILKLPQAAILGNLTTKAEEILRELDDELSIQDSALLSSIYSLRVMPESFEDDGRERAAYVYAKLKDNLSLEDENLLKKAVSWREGEPLTFLGDIKKLRGRLLRSNIPCDEFKVPKPRADILDLGSEVLSILRKNRGRGDKRLEILADFIYELENAPERVHKTLADYNYVFAATVQQSEGRDIRTAKNLVKKTDLAVYDTVIIDEAARVGAGDLLIPMAQGEKRIILVGDHRQLPQMLDEEVVKRMEAGESSEDEASLIRESVFGYLFKRLKKLEQHDGVVRTVTLDAQYRMHPLLGEFVSANFYEEEGGFKSPRPASHFAHNLAGTEGKPAVWIDVPPNQGGMDYDEKKSPMREAESTVIVDKFTQWRDSEEGKDLSYGIISFYRAQSDKIERKLKRIGIEQSKNLRIGTVDAFQGMEFDVVFLSMVRCLDFDNIPSRIKYEKNEEKRGQKIFGFLVSKNRLCVSMSRQQKLLVVVGDGNLAKSGVCRNSVPALFNFYSLCSGGDGVIL